MQKDINWTGVAASAAGMWMTGNPYVIAGATFAGGLFGGSLSYWSGAELGKRYYQNFLKP